jgi:hypothetical protein
MFYVRRASPHLSDSTRRRRLRPRRAEAGITLLEQMFAMMLMIVAITVLFQTLLSGQILSNDAKLRHRALQDTSSLMEQMAIVPLANLATTFAHDTNIPEFANLHVPDQAVRVVYDNPAAPTVAPVGFAVVSTWTSSLGRNETLTIRGVRAR